uniref:G-protein coupled receptors family 1 profile domain-containing protein n=1 Tax=Aotus nancymaae TaxID=37293 RepID=A0A2K5ETT0_AOTNA
MANYSHAADNILQNLSPLTAFLKLTSLGFIIGVSVVGNLLISILLVKDKTLHRAPYYFLLDLCCSDILRSAICFPFVFNSVKNGSTWTYGTLTCKVIAFLGVLSCFHTAFIISAKCYVCHYI